MRNERDLRLARHLVESSLRGMENAGYHGCSRTVSATLLDFIKWMQGEKNTQFGELCEPLLTFYDSNQNEKGKVTDHVDVRH